MCWRNLVSIRYDMYHSNFSDVFRFQILKDATKPSSRYQFTTTLYNDKLILIGGQYDYTTRYNDVFYFDPGIFYFILFILFFTLLIYFI